MTTATEMRRVLREANPVPDERRVHLDEGMAGDLFASIVAAAGIAEGRTTMLDQKRTPTRTAAAPRAPWYRRPVWVSVAAAAVVVLAVAGALLLRGGGEDVVEPTTTAPATTTTLPATTTVPPTTGPPVASTTTTAATTTTTVAALPPLPNAILTRAPDIPEFQDASIERIIPADRGFVAAGWLCTDGCAAIDGAVWYSEEGLSWTTAGDQSVFEGGFIFDVTTDGERFVAVGTNGFDGAAWISDDGREWTRAADTAGFVAFDVQEPVRVVAGGPGFVAVGRNGSAAGVWTSSDGDVWTAVESSLFGGLTEPATMLDVAAGPDGLVAVGTGGFDSDRWGLGFGDLPVVWVSADGLVWDRLPIDTFGDPGRVYFEEVTWSDAAFYLDPRDNVEPRVMWTSIDGRTWVQAGPEIECESADPVEVYVPDVSAPYGTACIGVGRLDLTAGDLDLDWPIDVTDIAVHGDVVVAAGGGRVSGIAAGKAAVWVGTLP